MSRSRKKTPTLKDRGLKDLYWRRIRKRHKADIFIGKDLTNPKSVMNDYSYCDYIISCFENNCRCMERFGRKKCFDK